MGFGGRIRCKGKRRAMENPWDSGLADGAGLTGWWTGEMIVQDFFQSKDYRICATGRDHRIRILNPRSQRKLK